MEYRKQAKKAMNDKISRYTAPLKGSVDASGWEVYDPLNADVKTGMRPVSRRAYKKGGKVEAKAEGSKTAVRADRKKRQSGGKALTPNNYVNRNVKDANQERDGIKHVGGMKKGGKAEGKNWIAGAIKKPGALHKSLGVPMGEKIPAKKLSEAAEKGGKLGKRARLAQTLKRMNKYDGGGLTAKEAEAVLGGRDPYVESTVVETISPKPRPRPEMTPAVRRLMDEGKYRPKVDPYEDRRYMGRKNGGKADHGAHTAIGHAVGAAMKAYLAHEEPDGDEDDKDDRKKRNAGGRIGKAMGGSFGENMNNPKPKSDKPSKGGKVPVINITINSEPKAPAMPIPGAPVPMGPPPGVPMGGPPMPLPGGPPMPPGGGAMGAPPDLGALIGAMGANGPAGPMPMPRRAGGRTMTAGAGSGEGRLQKIDAYGKKAY